MAYVPGCENQIRDYNCDKCPDKELGRISNIAFVKNSYYSTIAASPQDGNLWTAGLNDLRVILIPDVHGELPEPSEIVGQGYGRTLEEFLSYDYIVNVFDRRYKENAEFYDLIKESGQYHLAYFTETLGHLTPIPATILPRPIIQDDPGSIVEMKTVIKWRHRGIPIPFNAPAGLFENCYIPQ